MPRPEDHRSTQHVGAALGPTTPPDAGEALLRPRRRRLGLLGITAAFVLAGAACSSDAAGGEGDLSIDITAPSDGAQVGESFDLEVGTSVPFGEPDTGRHHLHLYFDGNTADGEYTIVYDDAPFTVTGLDPGEHTIETRIANADHSVTDARDEITVTVSASAGELDPTPPTASDDPGFDY